MSIAPQNLMAKLRGMEDADLAKYAQMHQQNPYIFPLAFQESQTRQHVRLAKDAQMAGQQQPKVVQQDLAQMTQMSVPQMLPQQQMPPQMAQQQLPENTGIGQLPAPNMQAMGKAEGGIIGYAEGGHIPRYQGNTTDGSLVQNQLPGGLGILSQGSFGPQAGNAALEKRIAAIQSNPRMSPNDKANLIAQIKQEFFKTPAPAPAPASATTQPAVTTPVTPAVTPAVTPVVTPTATTAPAVPPLATDPAKKPPRPGATTGTNVATPATPTGGIDVLQRENDAIARLKSNVVGGTETEVNRTDFLKELGDISKPTYDKATAMIEKEKGRLKEGKEQDFYMALIEGGLAAAGETGPDGLQNLAKGFSKGAASYRDALKDFRKGSQENAKMELELTRAEAAEKKGDIKTYYERMDKYQDRKLRRDDSINQGIAQITNTGLQGQNQKDVAHISGGYHVASSRASANAQRELMEALGNAEPDSALRKGFDLQKTIAQQAALYEQYQKMLMDPTTGMERPDVRKIYPNFQTYLAEYEKAIANKGAPGGGIKTIADPSKTQQPVMQR